jgi:hypothetical protein
MKTKNDYQQRVDKITNNLEKKIKLLEERLDRFYGVNNENNRAHNGYPFK